MNTKKTSQIITVFIVAVIPLILSCGCSIPYPNPPSFEEKTAMWNPANAVQISDKHKDPADINAAPFMVDIDRNGTLDLVVGYASGRVEIIVNRSANGFVYYHSYYLSNSKPAVPTVFCADVTPAMYNMDDGDTVAPNLNWWLMMGCADGTVLFNIIPYANLETVQASDLIMLPGLTAPEGFAAPVAYLPMGSDMPELVVGSGDGIIYRYAFGGNYEDPELTMIEALVLGDDYGDFGTRAAVAATYLNFDGDLDYVVGNAAGELYSCQGPAGDCILILQDDSLIKPAVGDFNNDGNPDLVYGTAEGGIHVLLAGH